MDWDHEGAVVTASAALLAFTISVLAMPGACPQHLMPVSPEVVSLRNKADLLR